MCPSRRLFGPLPFSGVPSDPKDALASRTIAAAALALDPSNVDAHLQKGYALFRKAQRSGDAAVLREAALALRRPHRGRLFEEALSADHPWQFEHFLVS